MSSVELIDYISPDNQSFSFRAGPGKWAFNIQGTGMPSPNYMTYKGPFQHGETVYDYRLAPRIIQINFRMNACSREEYWVNRALLDNALRPNRYTYGNFGPGKLRFSKSNGQTKEINAVIEEGPLYDAVKQDEWDEWAINEVIRFVAHDPIFRSVSSATTTFSIAVEEQLVFPITFPITFSSALVASSSSITYNGNWSSFPTIIITGPFAAPTITNTSTGEKLTFLRDIYDTEVITISLTYGNKTVTSNLYGNITGVMSSDSNLAAFHIAPAPEVPNGINYISLVSGFGIPGTSTVAITHYEHYLTL